MKHFLFALIPAVSLVFAGCADNQRPATVKNPQIEIHEGGVVVNKGAKPFCFFLNFHTGQAAPSPSYATISFPTTITGRVLPQVKLDNIARGQQQKVHSEMFETITNKADYPITIQLFADEKRTVCVETITQKVRCNIPEQAIQSLGLQSHLR